MKTHPLSVGHLVTGLVLLGIAGTWALRATGLVDGSDVEWLVPLVLVLAGGVGLLAFALRGRGGHRRRADDAAYDPDPTGYDVPDLADSQPFDHDEPTREIR